MQGYTLQWMDKAQVKGVEARVSEYTGRTFVSP